MRGGLAVWLATELVLAACGGSDTDEAASTTPPTTPDSVSTVPATPPSTAQPSPPTTSTTVVPKTEPIEPESSPLQTTASSTTGQLEPDRDAPTSTAAIGVPLQEILGPWESRFLEESEGYYQSYQLEPCFAGVTGMSGGSPIREPLDRRTPVGYGTVAACSQTTDPAADGGSLWFAVLDDQGTVAIWGGGTGAEADMISHAPSGLLCREFLAQRVAPFGSEPGWPANSTWAYTAALAYWFIEGRPARMDVDSNGIPCETLFSPEVVADVWAGDTP